MKALEPEATVNKFLIKFHFPIVGIDANSNKEMMIGTCTLLNIEERVFLVTAAHVINERHNVVNNELWIWNYSDGSKITITEDIVADHGTNVPHWCDVAIIEINISNYPTFNNKLFFRECFLPIDYVISELKYNPDPQEKVAYLIAGYSSSKNKISNATYKAPEQFHYLTNLLTGDCGDSNQTPDSLITISLEWDNAKLAERGINLPRPQGISGGGVWLVSTRSNLNPRLIGVPVAYIGSEKRVVAVKMTLVLTLIKFFYPSVNLDVSKSGIKIYGSADKPKIAIQFK